MTYNPRERDLALSTEVPAEPHVEEMVERKDTFSIETRVAKSNNEFAVNMYQKLIMLTEGNIFFSPYSIDSALSISYGGSRGTTEKEIADTLCLEDRDETHHVGMNALNQRLMLVGNRDGSELTVANAIWVQKDYEILEEYFSLVSQYYSKVLFELDFQDRIRAAAIINEWVSDHTQNIIQTLFSPDMISDDTALILTNAIYFKGSWVKPFKLENTNDSKFNLIEAQPIYVPLMYQTSQFHYAEDAIAQVLELPYGLKQSAWSGDGYTGTQRTHDLSMVIFLPREGADFSEFSRKLTLYEIESWIRSLGLQDVEVYLPRFTMRERFSLKGVLSSIGMSSAFSSDNADFTGISNDFEFWIDDVVHEAYVEVNEKGTVAAAATGIVHGCMGSAPPRPPVFKADRPFILLIRETRTNTILFLGRVMNPKQKEPTNAV